MSEWIKWEGKGEAPTGMVFVQLRDGFEIKEPHDATNFSWAHGEYASDIIAYKPLVPVGMVNSPPHYTQGGIECIDAIRAVLTEQAEVHAMELKVYDHMNQHLAREVEILTDRVRELEVEIHEFQSALEYTDKDGDQCAS